MWDKVARILVSTKKKEENGRPKDKKISEYWKTWSLDYKYENLGAPHVDVETPFHPQKKMFAISQQQVSYL